MSIEPRHWDDLLSQTIEDPDPEASFELSHPELTLVTDDSHEMSIQERYDATLAVLSALAVESNDEYLRPLAAQSIQALDRYPTISQIVYNKLTLNPNLSPIEASLRIENSLEWHELQRYGNTFPLPQHKTPKGWENVFAEVATDRMAWSQFDVNMGRNITSNVPDRGKTIVALAMLLGKKGGITYVEIGGSEFMIAKKFMSLGKRGINYNNTQVVEHDDHGSEPSARVNRVKSAIFDELISSGRLRFETAASVDLWLPERDPEARHWAEVCRFRPAERHQPDRINEYRSLRDLKLPGIHYIWADGRDGLSKADFEKYFGGIPIDVIAYPTVWYQNSQQDCYDMLESWEPWLADDAVQIVQDSVDIARDGSLTFSPHFQKWTYGTWARNMKDPAAGFKKYFSIEDGRVGHLKLEPALGELAVAQESGLTPES